MLAEFLKILKCFVKWVFKQRQRLEDVKTYLADIDGDNKKKKKEIDEVHDQTGLMSLLKSYCSFGQFSLLISLAVDMKKSDIVKELNEFEEKRDKLYKETLAKDFAKSAIEYCGTTGSREVRLIFVV